jgi:hypothetical protein
VYLHARLLQLGSKPLAEPGRVEGARAEDFLDEESKSFLRGGAFSTGAPMRSQKILNCAAVTFEATRAMA